MSQTNVAADLKPLIEICRETLFTDPGEQIPAVDLYELLADFWDEWFGPILSEWSPELRHELRDFFVQEMSEDETGVIARYTALAVYDGLIRFLTDANWEESRPEPPRERIEHEEGTRFTIIIPSWGPVVEVLEEDLREMVLRVHPSQTSTWNDISWEISVSCLIKDWQRAFQLFERARESGVKPEREIQLAVAQFRYLLGRGEDRIGPVASGFLQQTHLAIKTGNPPFHPLNWVPWSLDSRHSLKDVLLLADTLDVPEDGLAQKVDVQELHSAALELKSVHEREPLPEPFRAMLAKCYVLLGSFHEAAVRYDELSELDDSGSLSSLKLYTFHAAAVAYSLSEEPKKAIEVLRRCSLAFPEHTETYIKIAKLQANQMDYAGVVHTLQEGADVISGFDNDFLITSLLAVGKLSPTAENVEAISIDPGVDEGIAGFLGAYWPRFCSLCDEAQRQWVKATYLTHFIQKEMAVELSNETGLLYVKGLDRELDDKVFFPMRHHFAQAEMRKLIDIECRRRTSTPGQPGLDVLCKFVAPKFNLGIGQKAILISSCQHASAGALAAVGEWLDAHHPGLLVKADILSSLSKWRNTTEHDGRPPRGSEIPTSCVLANCRDLIECL